MKIIFIRHGQTDYNLKKYFYGSTDISINGTGKIQSNMIRGKVEKYHIDKIYTSELSRTIETAKIVFPNGYFNKKNFLNEWGFGLWEGMTANQIQKQFPNEWELWLEKPFDYSPPGAIPFREYEKKIVLEFEQLIASAEDIVIVAHLGTIRVLLNYIFPKIHFWEIQLEQENITVINYKEGKYYKEKWNE